MSNLYMQTTSVDHTEINTSNFKSHYDFFNLLSFSEVKALDFCGVLNIIPWAFLTEKTENTVHWSLNSRCKTIWIVVVTTGALWVDQPRSQGLSSIEIHDGGSCYISYNKQAFLLVLEACSKLKSIQESFAD